MEKTRRTNLFLSLQAGGFALVHVALKVKISRFLLFRDSSDAITRWSFQSLGSAYLSQWVVGTSEQPKAAKCLRFYKEIAEAIKFFESRYSWEYLQQVKKKKLYWDTVSSMFPAPLYRNGLESSAGKDVLRRLRSLPVSPKTKNVFIRFHTETLPVKTWLENKGFYLPIGTNCSFCGERETLLHVFMDCKGAFCFWADFRYIFECNYEPSWESLKFLYFGEERGVEFESLVAMALHALWLCRTLYVEAAPVRKTAWQLFRERAEWTLSAVSTVPDDVNHAWLQIKQQIKKSVVARNAQPPWKERL
ncbi:uncharacterized protein LOC121834294 [Ixodes scapularis]|uniref:uncharacterized protein LOC121834294 n=1 Tax=Ixodes scapularis TaxID=6945 RepID=UPI001C38AEBA|nr:uncharacterized protein LOC121834294 [Ixodes scapularis]